MSNSQTVHQLHLAYRHSRDPALRARLVDQYQGLARVLAARSSRDSQDEEDVLQVAMVGLLNALDRFDPDRGISFSTFAWATIAGEIKRYRRDSRWRVHVPRQLQELYLRTAAALDELSQQLGRSPTIGELAGRVGRTEEDVIEAIEVGAAVRPLSLDGGLEGGGEGGEDWGDDRPGQLGEDERGIERVDLRQQIDSLLNHLTPRERRIVELRFIEQLTQREIGARIGLSQMHVSRLLSQSLVTLRAQGTASAWAD